MTRICKWFAGILAIIGISCFPQFVDTTTPAGVPNLVEFAPNMWRMGQPPDESAWNELSRRIQLYGENVLIVKLDDEAEGDDSPAEKVFDWKVIRIPMPPEDDKAWTVFVKPDPAAVHKAVNTIIWAHRHDYVVAWHCVHGRDRTGLISALVGMKLFGWTKDQAWHDMIEHGFRWELPDLDAYWLEDVAGK